MDTKKPSKDFRRVGVGGWDRLVIGIKEGMCCDEHWVLNANKESWNTTLMMYCMMTKIT